MNKRFVLSVVVLFVVSMLLGFVVHGTILHDDYAKMQNLFRSEADQQAHFLYMIAAHVLMAIGVTWVYRQGRDAQPWLGQGVRFGLALFVLMTLPTYLIYFAVQPMPSDVVAKQIVLDGIAVVILGITAAAMNRDPRTA
jgi:magnesium-transporting ATPase (P-type)